MSAPIDENALRTLLKRHGLPLLSFTADGRVLVCSNGTWADGASLLEALESLDAKKAGK